MQLARPHNPNILDKDFQLVPDAPHPRQVGEERPTGWLLAPAPSEPPCGHDQRCIEDHGPKRVGNTPEKMMDPAPRLRSTD